MSSDDEVALSVARHLKRISKKGIKQDIRRTGPLRSSQAKKGPTAAATDKQWLEQCQQLYSSLPKHSRWAKHKLKVLSQAMELLQKAEAERTAEQASKLQQLLTSLNIGAKQPQPAPAGGAVAAGEAAAAGDADMQG